MILREYIRAVIDRGSLNEAIEAHILNFYEDLSMPLGELYEVIDATFEGKLEAVSEKMDGQNVTFTVIGGVLQFFSKGASWNRVQRGGMTRDVIGAKYADRTSVRDSFLQVYDVIDEVVAANPASADALFQSGGVVVESSMQMPRNPNTIVYDSPSIQFIQAVALAPDIEVDQAAYSQFVQTAQQIARREDQEVAMGVVPLLKLEKALDNDEYIRELKSDLDALLSDVGLTKAQTIGDLAILLTRDALKEYDFIPERIRDVAAIRLAAGDKSALPKKAFVRAASIDDWKQFQQLEKNRANLLGEVLTPIERIIQKLGAYAFRNLEFAIASNSAESGADLRAFVSNVRNAFEQGRIIADPGQLEKIRVSLLRIGGNEALFEKSVEGIVFRWKGKNRKLTGLFTAINKLRGFFAYGSPPARIAANQEEGLRHFVKGWVEETHGR